MEKKYQITFASELFEKLETARKRYMDENGKQGIPYFKIIIEKIKAVKAFSDIANLKKDLEKYDKACRLNNKYNNKEINPILSLFTTALNFLNHQKDDWRFKANLKTIADYDLSKVKLTKEDELSFSGSKSNLITLNSNSISVTSLKVESDKIESDSDNNSLISLINNEKDITILEPIFEEKIKEIAIKLKNIFNEKIQMLEQEKKASQLAKITKKEVEFQKKLNEIRNKKIEIFTKDIRIDLIVKVNLSELIKNARKWWHWPLKFFTCGMWESKEIRKINEDYISGKFHKKLITEKRKDLINIYNNITDLSCKINEYKTNHNDKFLFSSVNNLDNNSSPSLISQNKSVSAPNIPLC
ncbi:hypothetical protein [Spiroplasma endosymbiont of Polydrusus pterygomalis]|uniref:hypothetical protein n=1 Tax=Spiroplasma endosymbiont of Polydrusus pterygomalis TaxID=3139327 RepID=UPI003CCAE182